MVTETLECYSDIRIRIGTTDLKGVSMEQAAVHLLLEFWKDDVVQNDLDEFHWINEEAHLFVAELGAIAREMWRS